MSSGVTNRSSSSIVLYLAHLSSIFSSTLTSCSAPADRKHFSPHYSIYTTLHHNMFGVLCNVFCNITTKDHGCDVTECETIKGVDSGLKLEQITGRSLLNPKCLTPKHFGSHSLIIKRQLFKVLQKFK